MIPKNIREFDGIGKVLFQRSKRSKKLIITIRGKDAVKVTYPIGCSEKEAENFLFRKKETVQKHLLKIIEREIPQQIYESDKVYNTKFHGVTIKKHNKAHFTLHPAEEKTISIFFPDYYEITDEKVQKQIRKFFLDIYRFEAKIYLPDRLYYLAKKNNFNVNKVNIRNQKSLWGSCSGRNNISLNLNLMRLPDKLIDYIIFHELVHTKVRNHSKLYWDTLSQYVDSPKEKNKAMKKYSLRNFTS